MFLAFSEKLNFILLLLLVAALVDGNFYTVSTSRKVGLSVRCHAATIAAVGAAFVCL